MRTALPSSLVACNVREVHERIGFDRSLMGRLRWANVRSWAFMPMAIAVGLVVGALTCANGSIASGAAPGGSSAIGITAVATMPSDAHAAHGSAMETDHTEHSEGHAHPGMACLINVSLRVAGLDVSMVDDAMTALPDVFAVDHPIAPEPPVPRTHS